MTFSDPLIWLILPIFATAFLYASVGHAGASGYLAIFAMASLSPAWIRPSALILNILVAAVASVRFWRIGAFDWRIFALLAATSIPLAWAGGRLKIDPYFYQLLLGAVLIYAACHLFFKAKQTDELPPRKASAPLLLFAGGFLGFLSGISGVGGGIFLSPFLAIARFAPLRSISGISALFILVNSVAGLLGVLQSAMNLPNSLPNFLPNALPFWAFAALLGGFLGARFGAKTHLLYVRQLLAFILILAGGKMIYLALF